MKNLLFALLFFGPCMAFSQVHPIVTPLNEWVVDYYFPSPGWPSEIRRYTFSTDSVLIEGKYYHELIYSKNMSGGPWTSEQDLFREENGRTYKWLENLPERLIYDFDFGIGDSLPGANIFQSTRYVIQVDSIQLLDGVQRKRIILDSSCGESEWIEGAGQLDDLFYSEGFCNVGDGVHYYIRCFSTNGQMLYQRPDVSGCYTSAINEVGLATVKVFPNPGFDRLNIEIDIEEPITNLMIYNSLGMLALNTSNLLPQNNGVDISMLPTGFYTGLVHFGDGQIRAFKFAVAE